MNDSNFDTYREALVARRQTILESDNQRALEIAAAINSALDRIEAGTYGVCETCREPIGRARLTALPWAERCRPCQHKMEMQALPQFEALQQAPAAA